MATITVNLRTPSYATLALAKAEIQTNPTFTGTPTTIYYSDNGSGPGPSQGQPGPGVYVFTDSALTTAFNGQGNHWIFDGGNSVTHGNPYPYVLQIGNGSVGTLNNGMDTFTCTDVDLTIPGGADGELVVGTVNAGMDIDSYSPTNYATGTSTYGANITIPAGYNNSGNAPINCVITNVTVTTTTTAAPTEPDAPTIGTATAGDAEATVLFTAPSSDGGSAITSYTATSSPGDFTGTWSQLGIGTGIIVSGLTNGTAYTFTVTATNAEGTSVASAASNSVTPQAEYTCVTAGPVLGNGNDGETIDVATSITWGGIAPDNSSALTIVPPNYTYGQTTYTIGGILPPASGYSNSGETAGFDCTVTADVNHAATTIATTIAPTFDCETETLSITNGVIGEQITAADFSTDGTATFNSITNSNNDLYLDGTFIYTLTVNIPAGYLNSGTIDCDVSVTGGLGAASISISDNATLSFGSSGTPIQSKTVTITGNATAFNVDDDITYSSSVDWVNVVPNAFTVNGGALNITCDAYSGNTARSVDVTLVHPEDDTETSQTFTITQSAGNQAPIGSDLTKSITYSGTPTANNIDFNDVATGGWAGSNVNDPDDTTNSTLQVIITDISGLTLGANISTLVDTSGNSNASITSAPGTLNGTATPLTIQLTPAQSLGASAIQTASFKYKLDDGSSVSNLSPEYTVTLTINPPGNTAPTIDPVTRTISGAQTNDVASAINIGQFISDDSDSDENLGLFWTNSGGTSTTPFSTTTPNTGSYGSIAYNSSGLLTYTYTGTSLNPNSQDVVETFWYKAQDTDSAYSSAASITITMTASANSAPVISFNGQTGTTAIEKQLNQYDTVTSASDVITATDPNGDALTWSFAWVDATSQSSQAGTFTLDSGGQWTYSTGTWVIPPGNTVEERFVVTVTDEYLLTDSYTLKFSSTGVTYISGITGSNNFRSTASPTCDDGRSDTLYLDADAGADNINGLSPNQYLYTTNLLDSDDVKKNADITNVTNNPWISIQQDIGGEVIIRAVKLAGDGKIIQVVNCETSLDNAWPIEINFSNKTSELCAQELTYTVSTATVYQNVLNPADGVFGLADVIALGGQLFTSQYYANLPEYRNLDNGFAAASLCVATGFYNDGTRQNANGDFIYYEFVESVDGIGVWNDNETDPLNLTKTFICPALTEYDTVSIKAYYSPSNRVAVDAACLAGEDNLVLVDLYARLEAGGTLPYTTHQEGLEYLSKNQILIYTSHADASEVNYDGLWDNTTFIAVDTAGGDLNDDPFGYVPSLRFAIWDNENDSGYLEPESQSFTYSWLMIDPAGGLSYARRDTYDDNGNLQEYTLGDCNTQFNKPDGNSNYCLGLPGDLCFLNNNNSRVNVFYAFYSCAAKIESGKPYWSLYLTDGLHTYAENSTSYIKKLIDEVGPENNNGIAMNIGGDSMLECVTIQHKIFAANYDDAVNILLEREEYGTDIRIIEINPVELGFTSGAVIEYRDNCTSCLLDKQDFLEFILDGVDDAEIINRSIPNFDLEKNYELDNLSKPLLRTNPKLSTNAKLVVNSLDNMYIESIDASKELAAVEYKKWSVSKDGKWAYDLAKFFNSNKTPSDLIYNVRSRFSDLSVQESFEKQIEEDYHYGTTYNYSKLHNEDFRMLAPIWLDKNIPSNFVIFRVSDPAAILDFDTQSNFNNMDSILKNSELIKTFDLTRNSNIGTYIRNHVQSELFPSTPLNVNFSENERTNFNGIDLTQGGFTNKGEYLFDDFVKQDQTIINENDLITGGFERNKLACANLINLEFLFDDDGAEDYAVNRYFGLYVNDVDSGYGTLESSFDGLLKFKTLNSYINTDAKSAIPPTELMTSTPTLGYAHISDNFYKISPLYYDTSKLEVHVKDSSNTIPAEIKISAIGTSVDTAKNEAPGSDFVKLTINGSPANNDRISIFPSKEQDYRIKFMRFTPGEQFVLSLNLDEQVGNQNFLLTLQATAQETIDDQLGGLHNIDPNLRWKADGDDILFYEDKVTLRPIRPSIAPHTSNGWTLARIEYTQIPYDLSNNMFFGSDALLAGHFNTTSFSSNGSNAEIATALTKSINSKENGFTALTFDGADHLYIKNNVVGYRLMQSGIALPNNNANDWVTIEGDNEINYTPNNVLRLLLTGNTSDVFKSSKIYYFTGGNSAGKSVLASLDSVADINIGDYLETSSNSNYNKVIDIVDDIERLPLQYKKLVLEKKNTIESGEVNVFADNLVKLGLFSAFDIHDMNFDFYDTSNSDLKELKYETSGEIKYEPELNNNSDIYPFGERENTEYITAPASYFTGLTGVLEDEITDTFNEDFVESEYDRLKENYLKENSIRSRVVPSINKWVLKDTLTVREQPYYLNANEAFGRSNFSADLSVAGRDRLGMTHEWFYINNLPKHLKENVGNSTTPNYRLNESFSYLNFMEGFEMTPDMFKDINYDYFDRFFVTEGFETKGDNKYKTFVKTNRQKKYTLVNGGNNTAFADSIFKGLKVIFKSRKEFASASPVDFVKSSEFNGYRFSTVLNVKTSQDSNGIEYEVIQNKKFKYVVFFISLSLDDLWADQTLTRKLLYELNHSLIWNNEEGTFKYSDIKVDGHLDLVGANFSDPAGDNYLVVHGLPHADGSVPQFLEQINKNEDDEYGSIIVNINTAFGLQKIQLDISNVGSQSELILARPPQDITDGNEVQTTLDNLPGYLQYNAEYIYKGGGINAYKYILESLGAQNMSTMLLRNPDNIKYSTVELDGSIALSKFIILLEDGVEIIKKSEINTEVDDEKPESFKLSSGNIGYNLGLTRTYYPFLIRHHGGYTIDTTPVVTFTDIYAHMKTNTLQNASNIAELELEEQMYKHSLTSTEDIQLAKDYYKRYNRCGVAFNLGFIYDDGTHDSQWGYIKNHFYRKVNEFKSSGVIKLSTSSDKPPLYPLIGEVAIDKKDVHVFKSSWDKNYYTRALSGDLTELVPGTFETKEERSYLASTIMKIKDSYTLLNFEVEQVKTGEIQDDILSNSTNTTDVVLFEDKNRVVMDFYVDFTINKKLSADGVLETIKKYVLAANSADDKTTLTDDAQLYIGDNLVNVFGISQIKLYTQRIKGRGSVLESVAEVTDLDNNNYILDQNFTFSSHEQKPLNFRLIYNKRLGYSYRIRPMVKITS